MLGYLMINGVNSNDYGIFLTDAGAYGIAEKDVEAVSVAGRNGDLLFDNHRYLNKSYSYPALIMEDFNNNFTAFIAFLMSQKGYMRIEDSFKPEFYVMGAYVGGSDPEQVKREAKDGIFQLPFTRKPQRFLKEGENTIEITANSATIYNPCLTDALPVIRAYGTGTMTINGVSVVINSASTYTDIDCDTQNAYKGSTNCNGNITLSNGKFPVLSAGSNTITKSGLTRLEIKPNWWTL